GFVWVRLDEKQGVEGREFSPTVLERAQTEPARNIANRERPAFCVWLPSLRTSGRRRHILDDGHCPVRRHENGICHATDISFAHRINPVDGPKKLTPVAVHCLKDGQIL